MPYCLSSLIKLQGSNQQRFNFFVFLIFLSSEIMWWFVLGQRQYIFLNLFTYPSTFKSFWISHSTFERQQNFTSLILDTRIILSHLINSSIQSYTYFSRRVENWDLSFHMPVCHRGTQKIRADSKLRRGIYFSSFKQNHLTSGTSRIKCPLNQNQFTFWQTFSKPQVRDTKGNPITTQLTQGIPRFWHDDSNCTITHLYTMRLPTPSSFCRWCPDLRGESPAADLLLRGDQLKGGLWWAPSVP